MRRPALYGLVLAACAPLMTIGAAAQDFVKEDIFVTYHPTVGGHVGMVLPLYVRHVSSPSPAGTVADENKVVLFVHGGTTPVAAGYDLEFEDYSWMEALATQGFDVWAVDQTGYGGSARPFMDDPCNVDPELQASLLVGNVLEATCTAHHPLRFNTIRGEWEEIDTVVDYILGETGAAKVSLVGWSAGGPRAGGYASLHPEKVNRLFLYAPVNGNPNLELADVPAEGFTTTLRDKAGFGEGWAASALCPGQIEDGALDAYWEASMKWDPIGATWGPEDGPGFVRGPTRTGSGWTPDMIASLTHPLLVIGGESDTSVSPENQRAVFDSATGAANKVFVSIECGSHFILWEKHRHELHEASIEWLRDGTYQGAADGLFRINAAGEIGPLN
jgi:pimeloyl-ACP methyl ester carboxylesterase